MKRAILTCGDATRAMPYLSALKDAGVEATLVLPDQPIESLDGLGLVLAGGADVNPALYGATRDPHCEDPETARDELEERLLREALANDLPVLAICRGLQLFNVVHPGGTLVQHMEGHRLANAGMHDVEVFDGTRLAGILGSGAHRVNSRHHQAVADVGAGLTVSARSADGVVEGLERPDRNFAIAVQWHPEDIVSAEPVQRKLFEDFAEQLPTL